MIKEKRLRKNLHEIKNPKNLSTQKIKEIEENIFELEKSLFRFKKYGNRDCDDPEYREIRGVGNLFNGIAFDGIAFNQSIDEDYYKLVKTKRTKSAFNGNQIEYESKGDKDKNLSPTEYLDMIRPYL